MKNKHQKVRRAHDVQERFQVQERLRNYDSGGGGGRGRSRASSFYTAGACRIEKAKDKKDEGFGFYTAGACMIKNSKNDKR